MSTLIAAQREWAMDYMARNARGTGPGLFDTGLTYDVGADFCEAFGEAFPGRKANPTGDLASRRLAKLMRGMWEAGLIERGRLGNQKDIRNEPTWQYVYSLYPTDHRTRRAALAAFTASHDGGL